MRKISESEDNSIGAILYQGKPLSQWEKEFEGEFTAKQLLQLIRSGIDLGRIQLGLVDEADDFNDPVFKDEKFADQVFESRSGSIKDYIMPNIVLDIRTADTDDEVHVFRVDPNELNVLKAYVARYKTNGFDANNDGFCRQLLPVEKQSIRNPLCCYIVVDGKQLSTNPNELSRQVNDVLARVARVNANTIDFKHARFMKGQAIDEVTDEEAALDEAKDSPEDVVTVEDFITMLKTHAQPNDKLLFRVNKQEHSLFDAHSKGGVAVIDFVKGKYMNEDVELEANEMADDFMTVSDLRRIGKKAYPHNDSAWLIDNIAGIVNGKVIDFSKIKYARPERYPSNGTFFLLDGTQASFDAYEKEKALMLSESDIVKKANESEDSSIFSVADLIDELKDSTTSPNLDIVLANVDGNPYYITKVVPKKNSVLLRCRAVGAMNEAITYDQWQEAAQWFNGNGYEIEDDEARQEQFAPQGDQFLFKAGKSPTGKDEIVSGTEAYRLYKSMKENEMKSTNEGRGWYGGGYGGTGKSWKSLGGRGPRGADIGWYAVADLDPKAKGKMPGWRCGPSNFPFKDTFFPNRRYKVGTMVMRNKYVNAGPFSGEMYIAVPSYFDIVNSGNAEGIDVLNTLGIPLDLTFGMNPNDDYSVTYTEK